MATGTWTRPRNILLIQLGDIGDVVLTLPCLQALRQNYPEARITVAVREKAASLLVCSPWQDEVLAVSKRDEGLLKEMRRQLRFLGTLRSCRFDYVIDLREDTRGAIMALFSGAPRRIAFHAANGGKWRNRVFSSLFRREYTPDLHVADYLLELFTAHGIPAADRIPSLSVPACLKAEAGAIMAAAGLDSARPMIAVQPFSLWRYKEWESWKYTALIKWLLAEFDLQVVVTGGADQQGRAAEIVDRSGPGCFNLAGRTGLAQYAALLAACRLFIGVDSAGLHIAAAVSTPTIGIFGPSSPVSWAPRGEQHAVVCKKELTCLPCRQKGCDNKEVSRCLEELSVAEVIAVLQPHPALAETRRQVPPSGSCRKDEGARV